MRFGRGVSVATRGRLLLRGDDGYEQARVGRIFNARRPDRYPAAILEVADELDAEAAQLLAPLALVALLCLGPTGPGSTAHTTAMSGTVTASTELIMSPVMIALFVERQLRLAVKSGGALARLPSPNQNCQFRLSPASVSPMLALKPKFGGAVTREAGPVKGGTTVIATSASRQFMSSSATATPPSVTTSAVISRRPSGSCKECSTTAGRRTRTAA